MSYQLVNAKVWDGSAWVEAVGGSQPWWASLAGKAVSSTTTTVTANSSANTKGAWTQLVASTSADTSAISLIIGGVRADAANTATLLDIGIGASGSETAIASNIGIGSAVISAGRDLVGVWAVIPANIPSGSRVSARIQSVVTGGKTASIICRLYDWGPAADSPSTVDVLGSDTATSQGASFSGASGTYTQIVASTSQAYSAIGAVPSAHNAALNASFNGIYTVAVGAAGSEVDIGQIETFNWVGEGVHSAHSGSMPLFAYDVPAGSRLSVKHNISTNPDRYGVTLIGVPA